LRGAECLWTLAPADGGTRLVIRFEDFALDPGQVRRARNQGARRPRPGRRGPGARPLAASPRRRAAAGLANLWGCHPAGLRLTRRAAQELELCSLNGTVVLSCWAYTRARPPPALAALAAPVRVRFVARAVPLGPTADRTAAHLVAAAQGAFLWRLTWQSDATWFAEPSFVPPPRPATTEPVALHLAWSMLAGARAPLPCGTVHAPAAGLITAAMDRADGPAGEAGPLPEMLRGAWAGRCGGAASGCAVRAQLRAGEVRVVRSGPGCADAGGAGRAAALVLAAPGAPGPYRAEEGYTARQRVGCVPEPCTHEPPWLGRGCSAAAPAAAAATPRLLAGERQSAVGWIRIFGLSDCLALDVWGDRATEGVQVLLLGARRDPAVHGGRRRGRA
jgi:hypothetical protein